MDFTWIFVGLTGWALALVFVMLLMRMAGQQDRAARHNEKKLDPFSEVTITRIRKAKKAENGKFKTVYGTEPKNGTKPPPDEPPQVSPPQR